MRSTSVPVSVQVQSTQLPFERVYIATNGNDLIDTALSLDWMLSLMLEYVRERGEDVAVWMMEGADSPRLVASVKPLPHGCAIVKRI